MRRKHLSSTIYFVTVGTILTAVGRSFLSPDSSVSAQQESKGWKVWVKTSYCSADRQDWIRVAEKNPTGGGGTGYFMSADLIEGTLKCKRDAPYGCTFGAAMAEADAVRLYPQFDNYCCKDYSVWENNRTKEARVVKGSGDPGFGWRFVKGNLCGDAAGALADEMNGVTGPGTLGGVAPGTNIPGGDFANFDLDEPDVSACEERCLLDGRCKGFTYVNPGVQGPKARCWLKSRIGPSVAHACCTSGVVGADGIMAPPADRPRGRAVVSVSRDTANVIIEPDRPVVPPPPPPGTEPCNAEARATFARMTGTFRTRGGPKITIGGSCEDVRGAVFFTEHCGDPDALNLSVKRGTAQFTGKMSGTTLNFQYTTDYKGYIIRNPTGSGYCRIESNAYGTFIHCGPPGGGFPCSVMADLK